MGAPLAPRGLILPGSGMARPGACTEQLRVEGTKATRVPSLGPGLPGREERGSRNWGQLCIGALGLLGHLTQAIPDGELADTS